MGRDLWGDALRASAGSLREVDAGPQGADVLAALGRCRHLRALALDWPLSADQVAPLAALLDSLNTLTVRVQGAGCFRCVSHADTTVACINDKVGSTHEIHTMSWRFGAFGKGAFGKGSLITSNRLLLL